MAAGRPAARHIHRPGQCEFLEDYAKPFSLLVIADLLGVPIEDHDEFRAAFAKRQSAPWGKRRPAHNPLQWLDEKFTATSRIAAVSRAQTC